ncbi:hypothetical protein [Neorhodopirellula pilleata]|nr:hypothetical protein [Neorhodopirellula pilleata]
MNDQLRLVPSIFHRVRCTSLQGITLRTRKIAENSVGIELQRLRFSHSM